MRISDWSSDVCSSDLGAHMRHRVRICGSVALIGALAVSPAAAQDATPPNAQGDVAVTIYNNGQSLVQDERPLAVTAGRNRIEFPDVSARIRPETVTLSGAGLAIVAQNFDFAMLTPDTRRNGRA